MFTGHSDRRAMRFQRTQLVARTRASLALRLLAPVLIAVLPLLLFTRFLVDDHHANSVASAHESLEAVASTVATAERLLISDASAVVEALSHRSVMRAGGPACRAELRSIVDADPRFANLGVIDRNGRLTCSALEVPPGTNVTDRDYFQDAMRLNAQSTGGYQIGRVTGVASINVGYPIRSADGEPTAVMFGAVSLAFLSEHLGSVNLPRGAEALILDRRGVILLDTARPERTGNPAFAVSLDALARSPEAALAGVFPGPILASVEPLSGGTVVVAMDRSAVEASALAESRSLLVVAAGTTLLGGVLAVFLTWVSVVRPVERIRQAVRQLATGDFSRRLRPPSTEGTLNGLSADIDHMAGELASATGELRRRAFEDSLTGLPNRQSLVRRVQVYPHGAVVYVRAESLPDISATLGWTAGDEAMVEVSRRLRDVEEASGLAARMSGGSFAIFFPSAETRDDAQERMRGVLRMLEDPVTLDDTEVTIDFRAGAAVRPLDADDPETLVRMAELASRGPRRSDGGTLYDPEFDQQKSANVRLLGEMRAALATNGFEMAYQPIVSLNPQTKEAARPRFEALIRWPVNGQHRSPGEFIPLAERTGLIEPVDRWVLEQVCRQLAEWRETGFVPQVSVNISALSLQNRDLPRACRELLAQYGLTSEQLEAEITETALLEGFESAQEVCRGLTEIGIPIAVDDFGMGHSPLMYVRRMPVSAIKVDQSLVRDLGRNANVEPMIESMMVLAQRMQLSTVAEGVETAAMRDGARDLGVRDAQGYLYSPALPPSDARRWTSTYLGGLDGGIDETPSTS